MNVIQATDHSICDSFCNRNNSNSRMALMMEFPTTMSLMDFHSRSEYERKIEQKIEHNLKFLESLGLREAKLVSTSSNN
jgi:hypothetical protein